VKTGPVFQGALFPHQIDDESAHHPRCIADEAVLVRKYGIPSGHLQIGFVQQRVRANRQVGVGAQLALSQRLQFVIEVGKLLAVGAHVPRMPNPRKAGKSRVAGQ
jgi:hypothetical protein